LGSAKLKSNECVDYNEVWTDAALQPFDDKQYAWPSDNEPIKGKQYFWSALCRQAGGNMVQVTVFVSRKTGAAAKYPDPANLTNPAYYVNLPTPVKIILVNSGGYILTISSGDSKYISDGYKIVGDGDGEIYRVMEKTVDSRINRVYLRLDKQWNGGTDIWVVPPPIGGGRNPVIAVYQKTIIF
jgi:hypothetical protein